MPSFLYRLYKSYKTCFFLSWNPARAFSARGLLGLLGLLSQDPCMGGRKGTRQRQSKGQEDGDGALAIEWP